MNLLLSTPHIPLMLGLFLGTFIGLSLARPHREDYGEDGKPLPAWTRASRRGPRWKFQVASLFLLFPLACVGLWEFSNQAQRLSRHLWGTQAPRWLQNYSEQWLAASASQRW